MAMETKVKSDHTDIISNGHVEVSARQNKTKDIDQCQMGFISSVFLKLKTDSHYRQNCITSVSLLWSFVISGWIFGQIGPSFLDIQIITKTNINKGSLFLTMHSLGYLIGSLIIGILYDKLTLDKSLLLFVSLVGNAVVLIVLPWCSMYELMMFVHILKGFFSSGLDICGNAHLIYIWDGKCRTIFQALHFSFSVGGIISPYVTSPFLAKESQVGLRYSGSSQNSTKIGYINYTGLGFNSSYNLENNLHVNVTEVLNVTNEYMQTDGPYETRLYIPFSISAGFALSAAVPFLVIFIKSQYQNEIRNEEKSVDGTSCHRHELPMINKVFFFIIISAFMVVYMAIENSFNGYLATFCVKKMYWSKADGAKVTSVYWASLAAGKFIGIYAIKMCIPSYVIVTLSLCLSICQLGLILSAFFDYNAGIWMSSVGVGLSGSIIFPTVFTWTNEEVMRVSGKISSLFMITAAIGAVLNPIALGPLMEKYSPMWFPYIMLGESIVQVFSFLAAMFVARKTFSSEGSSKGNDIQGQTNPAFLDVSISRKILICSNVMIFSLESKHVFRYKIVLR